MSQMVHLHLHTEYSLLDGMSRIKPLMDRAKELGMKAIAITDHGRGSGWMEFMDLAEKKGLKYIIGSEVYIHPRSRFEKTRDNRHLVLLAKNEVGYANLCHLVTQASLSGFYYNERIDYELLEQHHEGLICLSACLAGDLARTIQYAAREEMAGADGEMMPEDSIDFWKGYEAGLEKAKWYKNLFGEDYYIEVQDNGIPAQYHMNEVLMRIAKELEIELVATCDSHYIMKEDAEAHDAFMAAGAGKKITDTKRKIYTSQEFYLKSYEDMVTPCHELSNVPIEAIHNTVKIADKCTFKYDYTRKYMPKFNDLPEGVTADDYLWEKVVEGAKERYVDDGYHLPFEEVEGNAVYERLRYEHGVICRMGYADYFLIMWDFVMFAENNDILTGPGRGSAAGSAVSYCLRIVNVDPLEHDLLFERFLNPARVSMPDIDWDIQDDKRHLIIDYAKRKYGYVTQIITIGRQWGSGSIRSVGRVMDLPYKYVDEIAKLASTYDLSVDEVRKHPAVIDRLENEPDLVRLLHYAERFEGTGYSFSKHAAGIVISPMPLEGYIPLWAPKGNADEVVVAFEMNYLEQAGFLKMDFLGLKTLTVIANARDAIFKHTGVRYSNDDFWNMYKAPECYSFLQTGETDGLFQVESAGMRGAGREMHVANFAEATALISLYRPGPMDFIPEYIANKQRGFWDVPFEELKIILKDTYGVIVYQEQVMQMSRAISGYSMPDADDMRKGISKKKEEEINKHRGWFVEGKVDKEGNKVIPGGTVKYPKRDLEVYYDQRIVPFARYAFNKSHAAGYAMLYSITAYLKYHHPSEFMAACLQNATTQAAQKKASSIRMYTASSKKVGIGFYPIDVNSSPEIFTSTPEGDVYVGLSVVKGLDSVVAANIPIDRSERGPFKDYFDFIIRMVMRCGISRGSLEVLVKVGAFDSMGYSRLVLITTIDTIASKVAATIKKAMGDVKKEYTGSEVRRLAEKVLEGYAFPELKPLPNQIERKWEKELAGTYMKNHPLFNYREYMKRLNNVRLIDVVDNERMDSRRVELIGFINSRKNIVTKASQLDMAFLEFTDLSANIDVTVFPSDFEKIAWVAEDMVVKVTGTLQWREGKMGIIMKRIEPFDAEPINRQVIRVDSKYDTPKIKQLLTRYKGSNPVYIECDGVLIPTKPDFWISQAGINYITQETRWVIYGY